MIGRGYDELAVAVDRDVFLPAEFQHTASSFNAETGFERTWSVVEPGVDDAAVVARLMLAGGRFFLEDGDGRTGEAAF